MSPIEWIAALERFQEWFGQLKQIQQEDIIRFVISERKRKLRDIVGIPKGERGFDIDIIEADAESLAHQMLIQKAEVKVDWEVSETGRIAVEYACSGKPSGMAISTASHWAILLDGDGYDREVAVTVRRERLDRIAQRWGFELPAGDGKRARIRVIPVARLVLPLELKNERAENDHIQSRFDGY